MSKEKIKKYQGRGTYVCGEVIRSSLQNYIKKISLLIKSIYIYGVLKIKYGHCISMSIINSIKGNVKIELSIGSKLEIGSFFMSAGPCYIKCTENAICKIGSKVFINHNCSITCVEEISIGNNCNIANNVVIVDHDHNMGENGVEDGFESSAVHIGENVWIGANTTILKGVSIGDGAVIAAGAVVNQNIPSHEIWGGVPAKKIKNLSNKNFKA